MDFSPSSLWWRRVRGLWKLPDGRDWLRGKLGLVLMEGAILSKSLIQFSVDGWSCVPFLLFTWGQTMVCFPCDSAGKVSACNAGDLGSILQLGRYPGERKGYPLQYSGLENSMEYTVHGVAKGQTWLSDFHITSNYGILMKIMATSFKRSHACTATLSAPSLAAGHRWPMPLPETPGHLEASLGQSIVGSLLLPPGSWCAQGSVCAHQEFISQSCVSSGSSMVGKPLPLWQSTADPYLHRRHSQFSLRLYGDSGICLIG